MHDVKRALYSHLHAEKAAAAVAAAALPHADAIEAAKVAKAAEEAKNPPFAAVDGVLSESELNLDVKPLLIKFDIRTMWHKDFVTDCEVAMEQAASAALTGRAPSDNVLTFDQLMKELKPAKVVTDAIIKLRAKRLRGLDEAVEQVEKKRVAKEAQDKKEAAEAAAAAAAAKDAAQEQQDSMMDVSGGDGFGAEESKLPAAAAESKQPAAADSEESKQPAAANAAVVADAAAAATVATASAALPVARKRRVARVSHVQLKELGSGVKEEATHRAMQVNGRNFFVCADALQAETYAEDGPVPAALLKASQVLQLETDPKKAHFIVFDPPKADGGFEKAWTRQQLIDTTTQLLGLLRPHGVMACILTQEQWSCVYEHIVANLSASYTAEQVSLDVIPRSGAFPKGNQKLLTQIESSSVKTHTPRLAVALSI